MTAYELKTHLKNGWGKVILTIVGSGVVAYGSASMAVGQYKEKVDTLEGWQKYHTQTEVPRALAKVELDHDTLLELKGDMRVVKEQVLAMAERQKEVIQLLKRK